ncbi:MAG: DivIVA domain-containing protein [Selenomonadaceae bacterium]|nr:DivIVA domain-containing protein [Selenomonadaceae bacterium]
MLTPMDIHDHQFKKSFRGYSENEVDDFLDKVVEDFEKLLRENERLKNMVNSNEKELEHYRKLERSLNETLMLAQRTADDTISSAKRTAEELKSQATRESENIREQARIEATQKIESATMKRDAILAEYDKFVREKNAFLMKLRTILESELTITVQMLEDVPKVDETIKKILPVEKNSAPVEEVAPVEKISAPVEEVAPVEKNSAPVEEVAPVEKNSAPVEEVAEDLSNIVDASTKPVTEEKDAVTDDTKTYTAVKPQSNKENAN